MTLLWIGLAFGFAIGLGIGHRNALLFGVGLIGLVYMLWKNHRAKKAERASAEAAQEPSLNFYDADWTSLDEVALDIARFETLTSWQANQRSLFRDVPVKDINVEGGWDIFSDDWGDDISKNYEKIFRQIRALSPCKRARRLQSAKDESASARATCAAKSIILPDGSKTNLPSWML